MPDRQATSYWKDITGYHLSLTLRPSCDLDLISVSQSPLDSSADVKALSRSTFMFCYGGVIYSDDIDVGQLNNISLTVNCDSNSWISPLNKVVVCSRPDRTC